MKTINTLVEDIYALFGSDYIPTGEALLRFGEVLSRTIGRRLQDEVKDRSLRLSSISRPCKRQLWYSVNSREHQEELNPNVRFKFLYGDILEELVLFLAEEAGHTVEGRQDEVIVSGVKGHRDAVIDGFLIDVKSASSRSFSKFNSGLKPDEDSFGYLGQLGSYLEGSQDDPLVKVKDRAGFLVIDKQLGHLCLDIHKYPRLQYSKEIERTKQIISEEKPPPRPFTDIPEGKSGNRKLGTECSYCPFKKQCWPQVRTFLYASGPVFLTHIERLPQVAEI